MGCEIVRLRGNAIRWRCPGTSQESALCVCATCNPYMLGLCKHRGPTCGGDCLSCSIECERLGLPTPATDRRTSDLTVGSESREYQAPCLLPEKGGGNGQGSIRRQERSYGALRHQVPREAVAEHDDHRASGARNLQQSPDDAVRWVGPLRHHAVGRPEPRGYGQAEGLT